MSHQALRAECARIALTKRRNSPNLGAELQDHLIDLAHLCDAEGLPFVEILERALRNWQVERIDPASTLVGPTVTITIGADNLPDPPAPTAKPKTISKKSRPA